MLADFLASSWPLILAGIGLYGLGRWRPIKSWRAMNRKAGVGVQIGRLENRWPR